MTHSTNARAAAGIKRESDIALMESRHAGLTGSILMYLPIATASCVGTHELLRCAVDCTGTQCPVHETPIITAPCPAALEPNRGSSRMLLEAGPFPNITDGSRS